MLRDSGLDNGDTGGEYVPSEPTSPAVQPAPKKSKFGKFVLVIGAVIVAIVVLSHLL